MCKIRLIHFCAHDHRDQIATKLFSDPGDGDFTSGTILADCEACDCPPDYIRELLNNNQDHPLLDKDFETCPWHPCCILGYQPVLCRWYWDNRVALGLDEIPDVEGACPNCYTVSEYQPLSLLVEKQEKVSLESASEEGEMDWAEEEEEEWSELPTFPAGELFYSSEIFEGAVTEEDSHGLYADRLEVEYAGQRLWTYKALLQDSIWVAFAGLQSLQQDLGNGEGLMSFATSPICFLLRWRTAQRQVRSAQMTESLAARFFVEMMKRMGFVLTALGKMPAEGQSITAADGSYSVPREQLDFGELDVRAAIEACDGPLKQTEALSELLAVVTKSMSPILQVPKRRNSRPIRTLPRTGPIPAMRRAKPRKH